MQFTVLWLECNDYNSADRWKIRKFNCEPELTVIRGNKAACSISSIFVITMPA